MWVDFATHHDPTPVTGTWTKFDPQSPKYLDIGKIFWTGLVHYGTAAGSDGNRMMYPHGHAERMEEWRKIHEKVPAYMRHLKSKTWSQY